MPIITSFTEPVPSSLQPGARSTPSWSFARRGLAAAAMLATTALIAAGSPPSAHATISVPTVVAGSSSSTAVVGARFMTTAQYVARFGLARARLQGLFTAAALTPAVAPPVSGNTYAWYTVVAASTTDASGRDIPYRFGDSGFGHTKIVLKHGVWNDALVRAAFREHPQGQSGSQFVYTGVVADLSARVYVRTTAVQESSMYSAKYAANTPDHRPIGVITFYCNNNDGAALCPSWINSVPIA